VARGDAIVSEAEGGEERTSTDTSLARRLRLTIFLARAHYLFLAPLIILTIPMGSFLGLIVLVGVLVTLTGLAGTIFREKRPVIIASSGLLSLLVSGKIVSDLLRTGSPDTAVLLAEFGMVIFLMEATLVAVDFDKTRRELEGREDEMSQALEARLRTWLRNLLSRQGKIAIGSIGLSILLLPLAGVTGVSSGELPLTGALVLIAVVTLLFLVTHRREPEKK
jgi:hypothetical protein